MPPELFYEEEYPNAKSINKNYYVESQPWDFRYRIKLYDIIKEKTIWLTVRVYRYGMIAKGKSKPPPDDPSKHKDKNLIEKELNCL